MVTILFTVHRFFSARVYSVYETCSAVMLDKAESLILSCTKQFVAEWPGSSLVHRTSLTPAFDHLQYIKMEQVIKTWSRGRPGNEANVKFQPVPPGRLSLDFFTAARSFTYRLTNKVSQGQRVALQCLSLFTGSPAPGHDGRVENAVCAPDTRYLHNQW